MGGPEPNEHDVPGRLTFRPPSRDRDGGQRGPLAGTDEPLGLDVGRDGILYVPDTVERGATLLVYLHGAGGSARRELRLALAAADEYGVILAAPDSRGPTWDVIAGGLGPDVLFIDRMLESLAGRCDFDPGRLAIGGVSDGASYALSLGLTNGDLFTSIVAFSPGFVATAAVVGRPRIFVSHGTNDQVLPIDACSRRFVPMLRNEGYEVEYAEFEGGHNVPPLIADRGFRWLVS